MSTTTANPQGSSTVQAPLWNQRARDWAELQEPGQRRLFETVLKKLNVGPGIVHLDVGCGAGMAVQISARRGARVYGFDAAAALIEIARERAPSADLRVGEMEALPYENAIFDLVTRLQLVPIRGAPGDSASRGTEDNEAGRTRGDRHVGQARGLRGGRVS